MRVAMLELITKLQPKKTLIAEVRFLSNAIHVKELADLFALDVKAGDIIRTQKIVLLVLSAEVLAPLDATLVEVQEDNK